jgi:broad specificity phosphatase PhoE
MLKSKVKDKYPDLWQLWKINPEKLSFQGMESLQMVRKRSYQTLEKIMSCHLSGKIAIVTHRAVLKPLFAAILNMSEPFFWKIQIDTAAFSIAQFSPERGFTFTIINEASHLLNFTREDL